MQSIEVSCSLPCLKQVELFRMQLVVVLYPLIFNVVLYHLYISILANGVYVISHGPDISAPQEFFHVGVFFVYLFCGNALYYLYHVGY